MYNYFNNKNISIPAAAPPPKKKWGVSIVHVFFVLCENIIDLTMTLKYLYCNGYFVF